MTNQVSESRECESCPPDAVITNKYFVDEVEVTESVFNAAPEDYDLHSVLNVNSSTSEEHEHHKFSTQAKYAAWGDPKDFEISKLNAFNNQIKQMLVTAGVDVSSSDEPELPEWFKQQADAMAVEAGLVDPESTSALGCYVSMRLVRDMCNPDALPGSPNACAGLNFAMFYPVPLGLPINIGALTIMNNKASAWMPKRTGFCSGGMKRARLIAYNKWFYIQKIGTITVCINCEEPVDTYVPFRNSLSMYDDRISSFISFEVL